MDRDMLLVANPLAGMRKIQRMLPKVRERLARGGWNVKVFETESRGDATEKITRIGQEYDAIVAAGGDGTLNEAITGLMRLDAGTRPPLGYIPAGSTNDFAMSLGLPSDILRAVDNILDGTPRELDVGAMNERYFSYVASFGAFTETSYLAPQSLKNALGHLAYILEGMKDLPNIRPRHLRIETENCAYEEEYLFGAISNSTSLGGILKLNAGLVDFSDGLFEIMLIRNPKNMIELSKIVVSLQSRRYDPEVIAFLHSPRARIYTDGRLPWSLDGEYYEGAEEIDFRNLYHAIRFITQQEGQTLLHED